MASQKRYPAGYGSVSPVADYRPWDTDEAFQRVYRQISAHTKVDQFRCYELWTLLPQALALPGDVLEVGVWRGGSGALLCARCNELDRSQPRRVYLADTFKGVVKAGPRDDYYKGGEHADTDPETVTALLSQMRLDNFRLLPGIFPEETAWQVESERICFCHVDVDVYQSARDVTDWVWPRLPPGGMIIYDDYGFWGCEGVTALGDEEKEKPGRVMVHNLNGHAVLIKTG